MCLSDICWVAGYGVSLLLWLWILKWGGARRLEGTFASGFLVSWFAPRWSAEGLKLFALLALLVSTIWFVVGIFVPEARL
jgi:hypothetical protein